MSICFSLLARWSALLRAQGTETSVLPLYCYAKKSRLWGDSLRFLGDAEPLRWGVSPPAQPPAAWGMRWLGFAPCSWCLKETWGQFLRGYRAAGAGEAMVLPTLGGSTALCYPLPLLWVWQWRNQVFIFLWLFCRNLYYYYSSLEKS